MRLERTLSEEPGDDSALKRSDLSDPMFNVILSYSDIFGPPSPLEFYHLVWKVRLDPDNGICLLPGSVESERQRYISLTQKQDKSSED